MSGKIDSLTGFRALAATLVLIGHVVNINSLGIFWIFKYGWIGVNFFFALSGFLFTYLYYDNFNSGKQNYKDYFLKRVFRIYPVYTFILFLAVITSFGYSFWDILVHFFMLHAYIFDYRYSINAPMWTLSVEMLFYIVAPGIFILLGQIPKIFNIPNSKKTFLLQILLLYVIWQAGINVVYNWLECSYYAIHYIWDKELVAVTLFGRFPDFAFGIAAGLFYKYYKENIVFNNKLYSNLLFVIGLLICFSVSFWMEIHGGYDYAVKYNTFYYNIFLRLYGLAGALMIISLLGKSIFSYFFSTKILVYLGNISFSLYLFHYTTIGAVNNLAKYLSDFLRNKSFNDFSISVIMFIAMNICAAAIYHFIEIPAQNFLRNKYLSKS